MSGNLIVFEGIDGSGKTTQIRRIADFLIKCGQQPLVTYEPTDNPIGSLARWAVRGEVTLKEEAMALLFAADRFQHVSDVIRPALESNKLVLCDRFVYSNMAYQSGNISMDVISEYNKDFFKLPSLTFFIDTSPEECTRRIFSSRQHIEIYDGIENSKRISGQYRAAFHAYKDQMPVNIIDGNQPEDQVFEQIMQAMSSVCKLK